VWRGNFGVMGPAIFDPIELPDSRERMTLRDAAAHARAKLVARGPQRGGATAFCSHPFPCAVALSPCRSARGPGLRHLVGVDRGRGIAPGIADVARDRGDRLIGEFVPIGRH
jgi:hypothetical protein